MTIARKEDNGGQVREDEVALCVKSTRTADVMNEGMFTLGTCLISHLGFPFVARHGARSSVTPRGHYHTLKYPPNNLPLCGGSVPWQQRFVL